MTTRRTRAAMKDRQAGKRVVAEPEMKAVEEAAEESDDGFLASGDRAAKNRLKLPNPRTSWPMEALDANRAGDVRRLHDAFQRKGAQINLCTRNGAYGGFRYATWGKQLGGEPAGETLLHLAVRPDNGRYPNRREVVAKLIELGADVNLRNAEDRTPRDVNTLLMDDVYPLKGWTVKDAHAYLESAGNKVKIEHLESWLKVFDSYVVDGAKLMEIWTKDEFQVWVDARLADLTRVGITAVALEEETPRWVYCLEELTDDTKRVAKAQRKRAAQAKREAEHRAEQIRLKKAAQARESLHNAQEKVLKVTSGGLGAFAKAGRKAAAEREADRRAAEAAAAAAKEAEAERRRLEAERREAERIAREMEALAAAEAPGPAPPMFPPVQGATPRETEPPAPPDAS